MSNENKTRYQVTDSAGNKHRIIGNDKLEVKLRDGFVIFYTHTSGVVAMFYNPISVTSFFGGDDE